jgi:hypothetical protein
VIVLKTLVQEILLALSVPPSKHDAHPDEVGDEETVDPEVDVEGVVVSRFPGGLEDLESQGVSRRAKKGIAYLWTDGITDCPGDDWR